MFFRRSKLRQENEKKLKVALSCLLTMQKFEFLMISADSEEGPATVEAKEDLRATIETWKKEVWGREIILPKFYLFCGEMTFKPLAGNANVVIAEIEKVLRDEPLITEVKTWQDMIMIGFLGYSGDACKCSETQMEVIDYLCKRWNIDEARRMELSSAQCPDFEAMVCELAGIAED